jgi:murein DD-endopeptidase MepM/ murein hydrolase activator NlpD
MRFPVAIMMLLVSAKSECAFAGERWPQLEHQARSVSCSSSQSIEPRAEVNLLADKQAGRLIERTGSLASDITPPLVSRGNRPPSIEAGAVCRTSARAASLRGVSRQPLMNGRLTSGFGVRVDPLLGGIRMHSGVDIAAPMGSPIFATESGKVSSAGWQGGYGLFVAIQHLSGLQTRYGHMSRLNVQSGQWVQKGEIIGFVGSTGRSTGPHLHYEVRLKGQSINPLSARP